MGPKRSFNGNDSCSGKKSPALQSRSTSLFLFAYESTLCGLCRVRANCSVTVIPIITVRPTVKACLSSFLCPRWSTSKVPPIATTRYILCGFVSFLPPKPSRLCRAQPLCSAAPKVLSNGFSALDSFSQVELRGRLIASAKTLAAGNSLLTAATILVTFESAATA